FRPIGASNPPRLAAFISSTVQRHLVALAPFDQSEHMLAPPRQRSLHRALVVRSVVGAWSAAPTAVMVQTSLDDVRLDADVGHTRGDTSPDIMQVPWPHAVGEPPV